MEGIRSPHVGGRARPYVGGVQASRRGYSGVDLSRSGPYLAPGRRCGPAALWYPSAPDRREADEVLAGEPPTKQRCPLLRHRIRLSIVRLSVGDPMRRREIVQLTVYDRFKLPLGPRITRLSFVGSIIDFRRSVLPAIRVLAGPAGVVTGDTRTGVPGELFSRQRARRADVDERQRSRGGGGSSHRGRGGFRGH